MRIFIVVPIKDKADVAERCLESIRAASRHYPNCRVIVVDNGSTDGTFEILRRFASAFTIVSSTATRVGGVRNEGARFDRHADAYVFIDGDCLLHETFLADVAAVFDESQCAAVGCEVVSPFDGHWSERAWDGLHRPGGDGARHYINSACFCIRSEWFWRIHGFDEQKVSSEDVDICRRLSAAGGRMWQSERLAIVHLGNPKSVVGLYRRVRWHGEGIWERGKGIQWSVSTIATLLHPLAFVSSIALGVWQVVNGNGWGLAFPLLGVALVPAAFVVARAVQHRRSVPVICGMALMSVTFPARIHGMIRAMRSRR